MEVSPVSYAPAVLKPVTLTEQVASTLMGHILRGDLEPGQRLVEQQLAKNLGVGQNVVREALIALAHRGFVRRITNRGSYVTQLSYQEACQISEVRSALEERVIELIRRRMQSEAVDLAGLETLLDGMRRAAEAGDRSLFYEFDLKWHRALWALTGNEFLSETLEQVVVPLFAFFILLYVRKEGGPETLREAVEAHASVVADLRSGTDGGTQAIAELVDLSLKHHRGLVSEP